MTDTSGLHREFASPELNGQQGPTFTLRWKAGDEEHAQTFHCLAQPPGGFVAELFGARASTGFYAIAAAARFVRGCLVAQDEEAWDEIIRSKDSIVPYQRIAEILDFLAEAYIGRPTTPPSGSPDGR